MPSLLASILTNSSRGTQQPFILLQSSIAHSCLPIIKTLTSESVKKTRAVFLFCFLHPPSTLVHREHLKSPNLRIYDWTDRIPGYSDEWVDPEEEMLKALSSVADPFDVIIDSADTLLSDTGSQAKIYNSLSKVLSIVRAGAVSSRLIIHILAPSPLLPLLTQTRFSPSLTHLIAHPPVILTHLSTSYLTPPPPLSTPEKFWSVFSPFSERYHEAEKLVYGTDGEGSGGNEIVVEVVIRGADGSGRRRGVERGLEGWMIGGDGSGPCELGALESLKGVWTRKVIVEEAAPDPTKNLSFNLNLTAEQQQSRAQVPLPYAHEGKPQQQSASAAILYDPDSADDIDDDDPDEDLDI